MFHKISLQYSNFKNETGLAKTYFNPALFPCHIRQESLGLNAQKRSENGRKAAEKRTETDDATRQHFLKY